MKKVSRIKQFFNIMTPIPHHLIIHTKSLVINFMLWEVLIEGDNINNNKRHTEAELCVANVSSISIKSQWVNEWMRKVCQIFFSLLILVIVIWNKMIYVQVHKLRIYSFVLWQIFRVFSRLLGRWYIIIHSLFRFIPEWVKKWT